MVNATYVIKQQMTQTWDKKGNRIPVTIVQAPDMVVTQIKTAEKEGYSAVQVGFGSRSLKGISKPVKGHLKQAKVDSGLRYLRETTLPSDLEVNVGDTVKSSQILSVGDVVSVTTYTKGTGFTGVMKRWGFSGGPRTHGQSDRMRAPGSIGQGTTPGRVYKGKKMAGRDGNLKVTQLNLNIIKIDDAAGQIWLSGTTPGPRGSVLFLKKLDHKDFIGLVSDETKPSENEIVNDKTEEVVEETQVKEQA